MRKLSERIKDRIVELREDRGKDALFCAVEFEVMLPYVEAQEREEQWTAFADKMPEPPVDGDKRILLVAGRHECPIMFTAYRWAGSTRFEWTCRLGTTLARHHGTHWRLITPPEAAGGER